MREETEKGVRRSTIIAVAVTASVIIYLAGVFSGLYANKVIEYKVEEDIDFLKSYVDSSALDFKNILLLQLLMENMEQNCKFSELYIENLQNQLRPYWEKLPSRLEEYEHNRETFTDEYITLKREYTRLSLRIWIISMRTIKECQDSNFLPALSFYSQDCELCIIQGEQFDILNKKMAESNKTVIVFPIDINFEDDGIFLLKQYYNITEVPSIILVDQTIRGRVVDSNELIRMSKSIS